MKLSIIIPVYNVEKYLHKCLNSVIYQTFHDMEIICINDGSTDSSLDILKQFTQKDERIKIYDKENQGQSVARNFGITIASGEYIGFVDADDWVDNDYFEKLYNTAKKYDADIACAGFRRCRTGKGTIRKAFKHEVLITDINEKVKLDNVPEHCYIWNKIYKKDSWIKANIIFPENKIFEDMTIILKILNSLNKMVTVPDTYYHYRRRNNSTITLKDPKAKEDFEDAYEKMLEYAKMNNINITPVNDSCRKLYLKILGLKVMKIKYYPQKIKYFLLGFIPIATVDFE